MVIVFVFINIDSLVHILGFKKKSQVDPHAIHIWEEISHGCFGRCKLDYDVGVAVYWRIYVWVSNP